MTACNTIIFSKKHDALDLMNTEPQTDFAAAEARPSDPLTELMIESLRQAVDQALDRKRRLSQYAVVWRAGRVERVQAEELGHDINQPMPGS